jgi:hypothetical protein
LPNVRSLRANLLASAADPTSAVPTDLDEALLPPPVVAQRLNVAVQTLARWRSERVGPPFLRVGGRIAYHWPDVVRWLASRRVASTAETDGARLDARARA